MSRELAHRLTHDPSMGFVITSTDGQNITIHSYGARPDNSREMSRLLREGLQQLTASSITEIAPDSPEALATVAAQTAGQIAHRQSRQYCPTHEEQTTASKD